MKKTEKQKETVVFIFRSCGLMAGMEKGTLTLLERLNAQKVNPVIVAPRGAFWKTYEKTVPFAKLVDFPFSYEEKRWSRFFRALRFFRSLRVHKVIWLHNQIGDFYIWEILASWFVTKGNIYLSHHNFPADTQQLKKISHDQFLSKDAPRPSNKKCSFTLRHLLAKKVISISYDIAKSLANDWNVSEKKIIIQPRGVDRESYFFDRKKRMEVREELLLDPNSTVFIAVNRFSKQKRIDRLLGGFLLFLKNGFKGKLIIAGDGPFFDSFNKRLQANRMLSESVVLLGFRPEVNRFIQGADFLLLASDKEGQSTVIKEAMACGTIPIVTDSPGCQEISEDIFVAKRNVFDFYRKIKAAVQLPQEKLEILRKRLSDEIDAKFNLRECSVRLLAAFDLPARGESIQN